MDRLKKIKPSFWDKPGAMATHPHKPLNFQRKWKLIVVFTSLMALLPLLVVTFIEYRLTRQTIETEMKNRMMGILVPAAESVLYALDRQTAVVDHLILADKDRYVKSPDSINEIQKEISAVSANLVELSVVDNGEVLTSESVMPGNCQSKVPDENILTGGVKKRRFLTFIPSDQDVQSGLKVYLCYFPGEKGSFKISLTLNSDFIKQFLIPYQSSDSEDIFVINQDGTLVSSSLLYGDSGNKVPLASQNFDAATGLFDAAGQDGQNYMAGFARIPNSSLILVMVSDKDRSRQLWLKPRMKLLGYLVVSVILILLSIMGMATYLVGRIHVADQKRMKGLQHAGHSNKMASIGRLASGVAHEINNPLAIINEKTGLILDLIAIENGQSDNGRLTELATDVLKAVERCGTVTRRLLDFTGNIVPCREQVDIEQVIRWVLTFFRRESKDQNIAISISTEGKPFLFNGDKGGIQQIFVNLLNNAFAAMDRDDTLDIHIRFKPDQAVIVTISDTGCGIAKEDIHKIFEPFFTVKENPSNTGLGLYVTYGLIKEMGGNIYVESELGKFTTLRVSLPVTVECPGPAATRT